MKQLSVIIKMLLVILVTGCSTFKGDIPIEQGDLSEYYISPLNQDGVNDIFSKSINVPEVKGLKIAGYRLFVSSIFNEVIYEKMEGVDLNDKKSVKSKKAITIPSSITWNGLDSYEDMSPDGVYMLSLEVWDIKGNKGSITPIKIIVDNTAPIGLITVPFDTFSPNTENGLNILSISQESSQEDLWTGSLYNDSGSLVSSYEWIGVTETLDLNGLDNLGNKIPDGNYRYELKSTDRAGNNFKTEISSITIDRRNSKLIFVNGEYFLSPNGDGIKDDVKLYLDVVPNSPEIFNGIFQIVDSAGNIVRIYKPTNYSTPIEFIFDGRDEEKNILDEGIYYSRFIGELKNKTKVEAISNKIYIDITSPESVLSTDFEIFSPDGDGNKDTITINQTTSVEGSWIGEISNSKNVVVLRLEWPQRAVSFQWDGLDNNKIEVPDGIYYYNLFSEDMAGNNQKYSLGPFKIDRTETKATLSVNKISFSPNRDGIDDSIEFLLGVSAPDGIESWKLIISDSKGNLIQEYDGENVLPKSIPWFGDNKELNVQDGEYLAELQVIYKKGNIAIAKTKAPFSIDIIPPTINVSFKPLIFSPDGDGINDKLTVNIKTTDDKNKFTLTGEIQDPYGTKFKTISKKDLDNSQFVWNGLSDSGELVQSASDYKLLIKAVDSVGNITENSTILPIDILVIKEGNKLKISISSIYFTPYTADFINIEESLLNKNLQTINRLSEVLKKYPDYKINIEGHAVRIFWNDNKKWLKEEKEILLPLSEQRSEVIRDALISKGVKPERMYTQGFGGYNPIVPHSDLINRWKNRRVEFVLIK